MNRPLIADKVRDDCRHACVEAYDVHYASVVRVGEGKSVGGHTHNDRLRVTDELTAVLATLNTQLSTAYAQGVITTNWNDPVTNWVQTSAPSNYYWQSIASSSDGTKLVAVGYGGGIWTAQASVLNPGLFRFAGVVVDGPLDSNFLIQAASNLTGNWTTLTNVALPWQQYLFIDARSATNSQQFYRAVPAP